MLSLAAISRPSADTRMAWAASDFSTKRVTSQSR
jgi:hypothetical protein